MAPALARETVANFDRKTGTRRSSAQRAETENVIAGILMEIKPFHTVDCQRGLSCKCAETYAERSKA
jgi:hypothetical protein